MPVCIIKGLEMSGYYNTKSLVINIILLNRIGLLEKLIRFFFETLYKRNIHFWFI
jgi:hypothetical protein